MSHNITKAQSGRRMRRRLAACAFLLTCIAGSAQASTFLEGRWFVWWDASDHPLRESNYASGVVGPGIEHEGIYYTVDISDTGLSLQISRGYNGIVFNERYPQVNGFHLNMWQFRAPTRVAVVSSPWAGFGDPDQDRLTFEPAILHIDFGGLTVHEGDTLVLSLTPVPEPAPAALLAAGLALLFWRTQVQRIRDSEQL